MLDSALVNDICNVVEVERHLELGEVTTEIMMNKQHSQEKSLREHC